MTEVNDVYKIFFGQIDDELLALLDPKVLRQQLHIFLIGSITDFKDCKKKLDILNFSCVSYNVEPDEEIIKIPDYDENSLIEIIDSDGNVLVESVDYKVIATEDNEIEIKFTKKTDKELEVQVYNNGNFDEELTNEEVYILALGMVCYWLRTKKNREEILKNIISDGDYKKLSSANMLDKILKLYALTKRELELKIIDYTYNDFKGFN